MAQPYPLPRETRETDILQGDGGATYGPFGFKIFDTADVKALVRHDGEAGFSLADISVAKVAGLAFDTFTVTFDEDLPETSDYVIQAARLHERQVAVTKGGAISGVELEKELSKQGSVLEELRRDVDRAWKAPFGSNANFIAADDIAGAQAAAGIATAAAGAAAGSAGVAGNAAGAAETARDAAWAWSSEAEDAPVDDGVNPAGFSAFHWYRKAWAIAQSIATGLAGLVHEADSKAAPVDADELALVDSADEWKLKKLTWADLKTALGGVFLPLAGGKMTGALDMDGNAIQNAAGATFGQFNEADPGLLLLTGSVWDDLAVLTDASTIAVDFNNGYDFGGAANAPLAIAGNRILGSTQNVRNGKKGIFWFTASGATRTLTLHSNWMLAEGVEAGPYSITTSQTLGVAYVCRGTTAIVTAIVRLS